MAAVGGFILCLAGTVLNPGSTLSAMDAIGLPCSYHTTLAACGGGLPLWLPLYGGVHKRQIRFRLTVNGFLPA